jgi:chromosome segregation ATPase
VAEQKELSIKVTELQEAITVYKYKVRENEEKIRGVDISPNLTEKKLNEERENLSQQISRIKLEFERTDATMQRAEREIDAKKLEIIALDDGDNTENNVKMELK